MMEAARLKKLKVAEAAAVAIKAAAATAAAEESIKLNT